MSQSISVPYITPHQVYYDDSGCNTQHSKTFLWAGYIATLKFWEKFGQAWNDILDIPPRIEYWHQTDVRAKSRTSTPKNPFHSYDAKDLEKRERKLCGLLYDNRKWMWAIAVQVSHAQLDKHVAGKIDNPKWDKALRDYIRPDLMEKPQIVALFYAFKLMEDAHSKKPQDRMPVSIHCENRAGDECQEHMHRMWQALRAAFPADYGMIDFPPGKSRMAPQLQAADMLAWHINRRAVRGKTPADPMWKYVKARRKVEDVISVENLRRHVASWHADMPFFIHRS